MHTLFHSRIVLIVGMAAMMSHSWGSCLAARYLWDASRENVAGNADWVIDADGYAGQPPESDPDRFPSPSQSGVTASTPETYWRGMNSSWAIELVKAGHQVESLPRFSTITYGNPSNDQDLSEYDVFILNEPQIPFTASEITALYEFIENGGGVFMIADHCGSDRNQNGWDSPLIFNAADTQGHLGMMFYDETQGITCDLTQNIFRVNDDPGDPVIHGPFGDVVNIKFNGSTEIEIFPSINTSVVGHAWRNPGSVPDNRYMVATCEYGSGRVAFVPDSSPTSDGTGDPYDTSYGDTFNDPDFDNNVLFLNICVWLAEGADPHPTYTPEPTATPFDGVVLELSQAVFTYQDSFILNAKCGNRGPSSLMSMYVILDVSGYYWFHPTWSQSPDFENLYLAAGSQVLKEIFNFQWPQVSGSASGLRFWGALLDVNNQLFGAYDLVSWSYE
ncbi:hypothetical protein JW823_10160 [bacterium]|nr:hypothetical protein [candidate division CSSED10-310 bacterium]